MEKIKTNSLVTHIVLEEEFRNKQTAVAYKITAPDGYSIIHRQNMSNGSALRLIFSHLGAEVEEFQEDREVRGCNLDGCTLKQIDLNVLKLESDGKKSAGELIHKVVKPALQRMGYTIKKINCYPYRLNKTEPNCLKDTLSETSQDN